MRVMQQRGACRAMAEMTQSNRDEMTEPTSLDHIDQLEISAR